MVGFVQAALTPPSLPDWLAVTSVTAPPATPGIEPRPAKMNAAQMLERLALLKPLAAGNRGPVPAGDPRRVAGEEYAWLIDLAYRQGKREEGNQHDERARALNSIAFAVMTVFASGISMNALAKLLANLLPWKLDVRLPVPGFADGLHPGSYDVYLWYV